MPYALALLPLLLDYAATLIPETGRKVCALVDGSRGHGPAGDTL